MNRLDVLAARASELAVALPRHLNPAVAQDPLNQLPDVFVVFSHWFVTITAADLGDTSNYSICG
ncbi:Protein of unknown function [Mycobacterium canettii CIPT 140070017]|nr:Protein of unknown function [Mycobacterium canettii CIPT 140070017]